MAEKLLKFDVVAPGHPMISMSATSVVVRTPEGEMGFLANHIPLIAALVPQVVRFKTEDGKEGHLFVSGGFVEVNNSTVSILCPAAEWAKEIDFDRARRAAERARERLMNGKDQDIDVARAEAALRRATERLKMEQYM